MICEKNICTGCEACKCICPKSAIKMEEDEYGNIYPKINDKKCIHCGLCKKVCPQLKENIELKTPIRALAMYAKNNQKRGESTSGGVATMLYEKILKDNGVVYGISNVFGKIDNLHFIKIENAKDLYKVKGSKYVHCYTDGIFLDIRQDLNNNRKVLFIGTPCQVSGLKSFLMKDYDNLITTDIICHGVPSRKLLSDQINLLKISINEVDQISFRDEKGYNFKIKKYDNRVIQKNESEVPYYRNFLQGNIYRENCYSCRYARKERISDITIGDFWGLSHDSKIYDNELKGISLVMPITEKGNELVNSILVDCEYDERTIDEACAKNGQLNHPSAKTDKYDIYIENYPKLGFEKTMKKMVTQRDKIKIFIKKTHLFKMYKKIRSKK